MPRGPFRRKGSPGGASGGKAGAGSGEQKRRSKSASGRAKGGGDGEAAKNVTKQTESKLRGHCRSRRRVEAQDDAPKKPAPKKPAPKRPNLYSRSLDALLPNRKTVPLHHLAGISSALHFLALANALAGALRWMLSGPAMAADFEFDFNLIAFGFYAYIFDVTTALVAGRSYFYRWTRLDVFIHHVPFMFVGGFWALATFDVLRERGLESTISYFQQAIRWAMLSCSNEFALALGGAFRREEDKWARLMSTWAGLLYFLVASPVWIFYVICALVTCYINHGVSFYLVLNATVPILYAVTQYPLFVTVYFKRLKKLYEIENVGNSLKKSVKKILYEIEPIEDLLHLADVRTWDVRPRFRREAGVKSP